MKKKYLLLLILPVVFVILSVAIRTAQGPYFFNVRYDPTYPYLINSLNISQGSSPAIVEHPGTPVQIIGAIVIKNIYSITGKTESISESVLNNIELYIFAIDFTFIFINAIGLFILGLVVLKTSNNIYISFLFQLSPFVCYTLFRRLTHVSPENLLLFSIVILIALIIKFTYRENLSRKKIFVQVLLFSIICGLGLATKLSFMPLIVIPFLLLPRIKNKIVFSIFTIIAFLICVIPAIPRAKYFYEEWMLKNIIGSSGKYGSETQLIIDSSNYFTQIVQIFKDEPFLAIVYFLMVVALIVWFIKRKSYQSKNNPEIKTLFAIFISISLQIFLVAKRYNPQYIMPALMISITGLYFTISVLFKLIFKKLSYNVIIKTALAAIIILCSYFSIKYYKMCIDERDETIKLMNFVDSFYPNVIKITSFGSTGKEYAYAFATEQIFAGAESEKYKSILIKKYPQALFIEDWRPDIFSLSNTLDIKNLLLSGKPLIFLNRSEKLKELLIKSLAGKFNIQNVSLLKVYTNQNGESVYEVNFRKE